MAETGLNYNYFRDYDPQVGRYVEEDPIGLKGGLNAYAYVMNRPTTLTDRFGLDTYDSTYNKIVEFLKKLCKQENETCNAYHNRLYNTCVHLVFGDAAACDAATATIVGPCFEDEQSVNCKKTACTFEPPTAPPS